MLKIPYGKLGLFFVDNREIRSGSETIIETIKSTFSERGDAHIFTGSESTPLLKDWLWDPKKRLNDMVIIGPQHQCNGIETEIVVHIYPADCPWCACRSGRGGEPTRGRCGALVAQPLLDTHRILDSRI